MGSPSGNADSRELSRTPHGQSAGRWSRRIIHTVVNRVECQPVAIEVKPEIATHAQYIDGEWVPAASGDTYDVINPSTEDVIAKVPASSGPG